MARYEGSGAKQMGMLLEGVSLHDRWTFHIIIIIITIVVIIILIIFTRPRPAFGQLGLGGSSRGYSPHG